MSRRHLVSMFAAALALAACNKASEIQPLQIASPAQLPQAVVDVPYSHALEVTGGTAPFTFSAVDGIPGNIGWLGIDPSTGVLSGTPNAVASPGISFRVQVVDANQQSAIATVNLEVVFCQENELRACESPSGGQCLASQYVCANGSFPQCPANGTPSKDVTRCGADCSPCDPAKASACNGTCECGTTGAACDAATTCCRGACIDTQGDLANCGACDNACTAAPDFGHPVCTQGACDFACDDGYTRCGAACVKVGEDVLNCGTCAHACPGVNPVCANGTCATICPSGTTSCNGACLTTAQLQGDPANCGSCGHVCPAPAGAHPTCGNGTCGFACDVGMLCNGACVDTQNDDNNCGTCGRVCTSTLSDVYYCASGSCQWGGCAPGWFWCDLTAGCESSVALCREPTCGKYACKTQ